MSLSGVCQYVVYISLYRVSVCGVCQCVANVSMWSVSVHRDDDVSGKHDATCLQVTSSERCNIF